MEAMARATAHPDHHCISSEDRQETAVYEAVGKNIGGDRSYFIIDKVSGRVASAVMSFGGFVGLGHSHYPIPWGALTYDTSLNGFRTNITEQQLKDAPEFSDDAWQNKTGKRALICTTGRLTTGDRVAYNAGHTLVCVFTPLARG